MTNLVGKRIREYQIEKSLGVGGMGEVYRAMDTNLNIYVAFKVMHSHLASHAEIQRRFLNEAQTAAKLDHRGIAKVRSYGRENGLAFIVMEYAASGSLSNYLAELRRQAKVVPLKELIYLVAQVADALDYAHRRGVIHRDMKPDNILLKQLDQPERPGEPLLQTLISDFGLAKALEGQPITVFNRVMGTPQYMSPEQALGQEVDGRSDLYSLGVVLYELATGQRPFNITTPNDAVINHRDKVPPRPDSLKPGLPPGLVAAINKSIAKSPRGRFQSGEMMAAELRRAGEQISPEQLTEWVEQAPVLSVNTVLIPDARPPLPIKTFMIPAETLPEGQYLLLSQGGNARAVPITGSRLTLGRSPDNDVVLNEDGVSRYHARMEQTPGGWRIVDLGSRNHTFLQGSKLLPDVAQTWAQSQTVQIGSFQLGWRESAARATLAQTIISGTRIAGLSPNATVLRTKLPGLTCIVTPEQITVKGSETGTIQVEMANDTNLVGHYILEISGLPKEWYTLPGDAAELLPGATGLMSIILHPPRHPSARYGPHPFRLSVISHEHQEVANASLILNIELYRQLSVKMHPTQIENGGVVRLSIQNQGNGQSGLYIEGKDPAEGLTFQVARQHPMLEPGMEDVIPVTVRARQVPLLGTTRKLPFDVLVDEKDGGSETWPGQVSVKPRLPAYVVPLFGLLLFVCCAGLIFGGNYWQGTIAEATETAVAAAQTAAAINATATGQVIAQVEATSIGLTAQAEGDSDGDGLSNNDEINRYRTNPDLADSDSDGLNDGMEINVHNTLPLVPDSDGDGLNDGDEVFTYETNPLNLDSDGDTLSDGLENSQGTDPTNRDTDGDGLPDNQDPDPLINQSSVPTATVPPSPTPPPSATPSPTSAPPPTSEPTSTATPTIMPSATGTPTSTSTPTATITPPGITVTEDCIGVNPDALEIRLIDGDWRIVSGGSSILLNYDEKLDEAQTSLAIMEFYRFTEFCFVGRPDPSMEYFLANNQSPQGSFPGEDCISINPDALEIQLISSDWRIVDGSSILLNFDEKIDEAQTALTILKFYRFNQQCFVGRPDSSMKYFRR